MGTIMHVLGEYVTWIDLTRDVGDVAPFSLIKFANMILAKIGVFNFFGGDGS